MRCERFALTGDPVALAHDLRALVATPESVSEAVAKIVARIRDEGDAALLEYTRALDTEGTDPKPLRVAEVDLEAGAEAVAPTVCVGLVVAFVSVEGVARGG